MTLREHIENKIAEKVKILSDEELFRDGQEMEALIEECTTDTFCKFCRKLQGGTCQREGCPEGEELSAVMRMEYEA